MNFLQAAMLIGATSLITVTAGLLIVRTMPSRDGIGWWVVAAIQQTIIYFLGLIFLSEQESVASLVVFLCLQMCSLQCLCVGLMLYIKGKSEIAFRLRSVLLAMAAILIAAISDNMSLAKYIFAVYLSITLFSLGMRVWRSEESTVLLKLTAVLIFTMSLHWLDYPILSDVVWFAPIGFLIGIVQVVGLYFLLATTAMLQFKQITNESEQRAVRCASHDPLTDLYNRSQLEILYEKYKAATEDVGGSFLLLYIDLDGFKAVNDTYGHKAGDAILIVVAKRLTKWLGSKGDAVRIGGDELVVINSLRSETSSAIVYGTSAAESVLGLLEQPIIDGENVYNISGSIGACYYDPADCGIDEMLSKADDLMYQAKQSGGGRVVFKDAPKEIVPVSVSETSQQTPPQEEANITN